MLRGRERNMRSDDSEIQPGDKYSNTELSMSDYSLGLPVALFYMSTGKMFVLF